MYKKEIILGYEFDDVLDQKTRELCLFAATLVAGCEL